MKALNNYSVFTGIRFLLRDGDSAQHGALSGALHPVRELGPRDSLPILLLASKPLE